MTSAAWQLGVFYCLPHKTTNSDITWDGSHFVAIWEFSREALAQDWGKTNLRLRNNFTLFMSAPFKVRSWVPRRPSGPMVSPTGKKWEFVNEPLDSPTVGDTAREAHGFSPHPEVRVLQHDWGWVREGLGQQLHTVSPRMPPSGNKMCGARISIERLWKCFRIPRRADWRYFSPKPVSKDQGRCWILKCEKAMKYFKEHEKSGKHDTTRGI